MGHWDMVRVKILIMYIALEEVSAVSSLSRHLAAQHIWMPGIYALALRVFFLWGFLGSQVVKMGQESTS